MYSLSTLDVRFLYRKDVLAVVRVAQSEERQVFWSILSNLRKIALVGLFFFSHYKGIKILHVKFGNYRVTKYPRAWTNNNPVATLKLLQQTEI